MNELEQAKELLQQENVTFAAITKAGAVTSAQRGIAPIMNLLQKDVKSLQGAFVADRIIGKAAALLLIKSGITKLYAGVISRHALDVLEESDIEVEYKDYVPYIINRKGDGMCPMEECVLHTNDAQEAYELLCKKLEQLRSQ